MGDACQLLPKPMLQIDGKPILQRQIEALSKEGVSDFLIVAGYLHEAITEYFGTGERFGVRIRYFIEPQPMGTGGALKQLNLTEDFLLVNGDLLFEFSLQPLLAFHRSKQARITVYAHPNAHPFDSTLLQCDPQTDEVISCGRYTAGSDVYPNLCNAGIQIVSPAALDIVPARDYLRFDEDILVSNIETGRVYAYRRSEYILDVGTPERLEEAERLAKSDLLKAKRCDRPQRAVFLDRDGTINQHKGYIDTPNQMVLLPGVATAINRFHALGYLVIVITNQPVVARGQCSVSELHRIHNRMEMLLGMDGAFVDAIYFCPHHPDKGFPNEDARYKIRCDCRKPAPGMILRAAETYRIDLSCSYMVGDSHTDIETAQNAGCVPVHLKRASEDDSSAALSFDDLLHFSAFLLQKGEENNHVAQRC